MFTFLFALVGLVIGAVLDDVAAQKAKGGAKPALPVPPPPALAPTPMPAPPTS